MSMLSPFDGRNTSIFVARTAVRELIEDLAEQDRLQEVALDQHRYVCYLAATALQRYVSSGEVTIVMISRWVMEAVASAAKSLN